MFPCARNTDVLAEMDLVRNDEDVRPPTQF